MLRRTHQNQLLIKRQEHALSREICLFNLAQKNTTYEYPQVGGNNSMNENKLKPFKVEPSKSSVLQLGRNWHQLRFAYGQKQAFDYPVKLNLC